MTLRASTIFATYTALGLLLLAVIVIDSSSRSVTDRQQLEERRTLVKSLSLTDLVLFTDARYTRHPSMADRHTPFQDYPLSLEHFPSGSLIPPPPHVRSYGKY
ncbi:MAG TPA: hypothetical protein DER40_10025 [Geobacter sp.]|nr:MAG: hypothetical protein A2X85_03695 [Geobacteraceae bacterium GWF2_54_21]HCE67831.1 hypothetical protein [Geobacter sp.]